MPLSVITEALQQHAITVAGIGETAYGINAAAATTTVVVTPPASDEVSIAVAQWFSAQGARFQQVNGKAMLGHQRIVGNIETTANSYEAAEDANNVSF